MKLDGYKIVSEAATILPGAPQDLINFLLSNEVNKLNNYKNKQESDIKKNSIKMTSHITEWATSKEIEPKSDWHLIRSFMISKKLVPIFGYRNSDIACYSIKDQMIYDWNHDLNTFNALSKEGGTKPTNYKDWMKQILSQDRLDAWR